MKYKNAFIMPFVFLIFTYSALAISGAKYLNEFNNADENCSLNQKYFEYYKSDESVSVAVFYECCNENSCITLPFDIYKLKPYSKQDLQELFNSKYVAQALDSGKISEQVYHYGDSFNLCDYLGPEVFTEQSISLTGEGYDLIKSNIPKDTRKTISALKSLLKGVGIIKEFNPVKFAGSVVCWKLTGAEKKAFEQLYLCNENLQLIKNGKSYYTITSQMKDCNKEARMKINAVLNSNFQKAKAAGEKTVGYVTGFYRYIKDIGEKDNKFEIEKTDYEKLKESLNKINSEDPMLEDPNSLSFAHTANERFQEKINAVVTAKHELISGTKSIKANIPNIIKIFIKNIFLEPNYNITKLWTKENEIESLYNNYDDLALESKFNSALSLKPQIQEQNLIFNSLVERENNTERKFDKRWVIVPIVALVFVAVLIFIFRKLK